MILLLKIIKPSMENINKPIDKNTWNFTRSPGDGHFYYCRHVYFYCYGIFVSTLNLRIKFLDMWCISLIIIIIIPCSFCLCSPQNISGSVYLFIVSGLFHAQFICVPLRIYPVPFICLLFRVIPCSFCLCSPQNVSGSVYLFIVSGLFHAHFVCVPLIMYPVSFICLLFPGYSMLILFVFPSECIRFHLFVYCFRVIPCSVYLCSPQNISGSVYLFIVSGLFHAQFICVPLRIYPVPFICLLFPGYSMLRLSVFPSECIRFRLSVYCFHVIPCSVCRCSPQNVSGFVYLFIVSGLFHAHFVCFSLLSCLFELCH